MAKKSWIKEIIKIKEEREKLPEEEAPEKIDGESKSNI